MVELVKNNLEEIADACKKHHVKALYIFGSAARVDDFTDKSDVDFLVNFDDLPETTDEEVFYQVENYDHLQEKLEKILSRKVDLIQEQNIRNKYLRYFINKDKKLVYGLS
jgi:predicted nucleotidyltransferase